jgi:predicted secreted protein
MAELVDKEILVVAHCLLNPFTRVKGLEPISFHREGPLVQLPCPEALYLGLDRWAVTRNQLDVPEFRRFCQSLITHYVDLLDMMVRKGATITVVGMAGSPSCGVVTTSSGYTGGQVHETAHERVCGRGIFMEELSAELERRSVAFRAEEVGQKQASNESFEV